MKLTISLAALIFSLTYGLIPFLITWSLLTIFSTVVIIHISNSKIEEDGEFPDWHFLNPILWIIFICLIFDDKEVREDTQQNIAEYTTNIVLRILT